MELTRQELSSIVERSRLLDERLAQSFIDPLPLDSSFVKARLSQWSQTVARGNLEVLAKRLSWDGLDLDTVQQALNVGNAGDTGSEQPLPAWATTLNSILQAVALFDPSELTDRCLQLDDPVPFESIFVPCISLARQQLVTRSGDPYTLLSDKAHASLERSLLIRFANLCFRTLELEFSIFRSRRQSSFDRLLTRSQDQPSRTQYINFIQYLCNGGLQAVVQEYTVLARLIATVLDSWVESTQEFLQRLAADWEAIAAVFQPQTMSQVVEVYPGLSDAHHGGRTVLSLEFAGGFRLIYKPRTLELEVAYFQLLDWLNHQTALPLAFKVLRILERSTHGWVEFVAHRPCQSIDEIQRYYQRCGMLLGVIYALNGTDFHYENLIACADQPVLVDLEMLMHPTLREFELEEMAMVQQPAWQRFNFSVLRTMFLPQVIDTEGQIIDISGLGAMTEQELQVRKLKDINTDRMATVKEAVKTSIKTTSPFAAGVTDSVIPYIEAMVTGFEQIYHGLLEHRDRLLAINSPFAAFVQQPGRYLHRHTGIYYSVIRQALNPDALRYGVDFSIALDLFSRPLLALDAKPYLWSILSAERQALAQLDIPHLQVNSSSSALILNHAEAIEDFFDQPGYEAAIAHVQQLNLADLNQQIEIIRYTLYSTEPQRVTWAEPVLAVDPRLQIKTITPASPDINVNSLSSQLMQQAIHLGQEIQQRAIVGHDGSANWLGLDYNPTVQLRPLPLSLCNGNAGIALFLAALSARTGKTCFGDTASAALQPLRQILRGSNQDFQLAFADYLGVGGGLGLGSIVYALTKISAFLKESALLEDAAIAASLMTPELIAADQQFNVLSGVAGAILGLLALYHSTEDTGVLKLALACGQHLLNWQSNEDCQRSGFAYGAAGIAYALGRLYETSDDSTFLAAAKTAIAFEQQLFDSEVDDWADRKSDQPMFYSSWAQGAAGIGLARLGLVSILPEEIQADMAAALHTTQSYALDGADHLCWGSLGRLETLWVAAQKLNRPDLRTFVERSLTKIITQTNGTFRLLPTSLPPVYNPSLFHGTAGVGYQLLRFSNSSLLPSVLLWE